MLNKIDLLPHAPFDREAFWRTLARVNRKAVTMEISCVTGEGLDRWLKWFVAQAAEARLEV